ncbi:uncharacterized protein LOC117338932 [Pecten maximus]|uniref:uncharacterized protein LOC117338932 n=1 Tax=Pecten maximus TaxID=6579 RepID=UPI00145800FD|nr:uncharacterized protein LOC117338932 [Pecten maximus]
MMSRLCLACAKSVRPRQEALQCHGCRGWQHRICTPAITREMYRATLRGEEGAIIAWCCSGCDIPTISLDESTDTALESTMVYAEDTPPVLELSAVPVAPLLCPSDTPPLLEASVTVDLSMPPVLEMSVPEATPDRFDEEPPVLEMSTATPTNSTFAVPDRDFSRNFDLSPVRMNSTFVVPPPPEQSLNASFDLTVQDDDDPVCISERSLGDAPLTDTVVVDEDTTYEIVESGTIRRCRKLIATDGYSYTVKVLRHLLTCFESPPEVEGFMLDFEAGCWRAVRSVFPGVDLKGCSFHWAQAVLRKVDSLGLRATFRKRQVVSFQWIWTLYLQMSHGNE